MIAIEERPANGTAKPQTSTQETRFTLAPPELELAEGETQVFCTSLARLSPYQRYFESLLSADELVRAGRFACQRDRLRFVTGRGLAREVLGKLLAADPADLVFATGTHGKPRLVAPVNNRYLYFNLAHSDELVAFVVSENSLVGIDVEKVRPVFEVENIVARFFTPREYAAWRLMPAERRMELFFEIWTRKEALLKAAGTGIGSLLNQVEIPVQPGDELPPGHFIKAPALATGFFLHLSEPAPAYKLAVAVSQDEIIRYWHWRGL